MGISAPLLRLWDGVKRRLGLGKPTTGRPARFSPASTGNAREAVALLRDGALPAVPMIPESRVEAEYRDLQMSWGCRGLKKGTMREIAETVQKNLEKDAKLPRFREFSVEVLTDQYCAQVYSHFEQEPGARFATANAYRIWRTDRSVFFCGSKNAIL